MSAFGVILPQVPSHFTHHRLHIRTAQDAHRIFEAVRKGILPLIKRRLSPSERDLLASGQVFVWEEASSGSVGDEGSATSSGLERWTDGRRWSQSRMREPFLFYEEKVQTTAEEKHAKAERRARKASTSDSAMPPGSLMPPVRRQDRPSKPDGLTKQTYSSYVHLPNSQVPRKWHCVAYFNAADYNNLPVVESYPELRDLVVPDGIYVSAKGTGRNGSATPSFGTPAHSYHAAPTSIGPTRRPSSRGEYSSSPYGTPPSRSRASSGGMDPYSRPHLPPPSYSPHLHHPHHHHHHSSSISSASTGGSPPTPSYFDPVPSPSSFNYQQRYSPNLKDVRTPTKQFPYRSTPSPIYDERRSSDERRSDERRSDERRPSDARLSLDSNGRNSPRGLPSLSTVIQSTGIAHVPGRSDVDSKALGAFRVVL